MPESDKASFERLERLSNRLADKLTEIAGRPPGSPDEEAAKRAEYLETLKAIGEIGAAMVSERKRERPSEVATPDMDDDELEHPNIKEAMAAQLSPEDFASWSALQNKWSAKEDEIAAHIARDLGFGDLSGLTDEQKIELTEEVENAIDSWDEADVDDAPGTRNPTGELQRLLWEHHDIGLLIMHYQDKAARGK
jgi:hypothetical protein